MSRSAATPIFYKLTVTQNGLLSLAYSYNGGAYQQVISGQLTAASATAAPGYLAPAAKPAMMPATA